MQTEREVLLDEANSLGLEFATNIPSTKLKEMIAVEKGEPIVKPKEVTKAVNPNLRPRLTLRQRITAAKKIATKLHVVTITNKDNRENDMTTTAPLSFENEFFGVSRDVPLDIPVEIEACLIDIAEGTLMTLHKDEIKDGKRTGNKVPVRVKKYAISYGKSEE